MTGKRGHDILIPAAPKRTCTPFPSSIADLYDNNSPAAAAAISTSFSAVSFECEMNLYSDLVCRSRTGDSVPLLPFWRSLCRQLCLLNMAARSLFLIPASSSPFKRVFSQSSLVMRPHCSRLGAGVLEEIVFLKCNVAKLV